MTDLEQFIEFFTMKGVPFDEALGETIEVLWVDDMEFQFERGEFVGIASLNDFIPRVPAEESK